jgi:hypothetical protein
MEAACSETSVDFQQTTQCYIPDELYTMTAVRTSNRTSLNPVHNLTPYLSLQTPDIQVPNLISFHCSDEAKESVTSLAQCNIM